MKSQLMEEVRRTQAALWEISDYLYAHPELGNQEFQALEKLTSFLAGHGFTVEKGVSDIPTAFRAIYDSGRPGASVAYLCEYDALPDIGHGCGHNVSGTMSAGAAVALSKVLSETGGRIVVLGTPAEETCGAKVEMASKGLFDGMAAAMMIHMYGKTCMSGPSLALEALEFDFTGKESHAASAPEKGINALDAVIMLFNGINALRQHVSSDVRMHGIITRGGTAPNIVPARATARFNLRAQKKSVLREVVKKVSDIAAGAALITGAAVRISRFEPSYDDMNTNSALSAAFHDNLIQAGVTEIHPPESIGSLDMGNVSYVVPSIHPLLGIGNPACSLHTREMADATVTDAAHEILLQGACALALTGYDVLSDPCLRERIEAEFAHSAL